MIDIDKFLHVNLELPIIGVRNLPEFMENPIIRVRIA